MTGWAKTLEGNKLPAAEAGRGALAACAACRRQAAPPLRQPAATSAGMPHGQAVSGARQNYAG